MVKDAEANADEDHRLRELADSRNRGDALVHSTKKAVAEYGDKVDAAEKEKIEAALKDLEEALKSTADKAAIDAKIETLATASQKLGEKMYADTAAAQGAAGAAAGGANSAGAAGGPDAHAAPEHHDDVVDADFKEVKES
jgi:molecular chaperone DnaK